MGEVMGHIYARVETRRVPMFDDAAAAKVAEHISAKYPQPFDAMALIEEKCGRFVRGKHTGKLRGWATIEVVTVGGWKKDGPGYRHGHVVLPGIVLRVTIADDYAGKTYLDVA